MIRCPFCKEEIQDDAVVCKHCSSSLTTAAAKEKIKSQKKASALEELRNEIAARGFPKEIAAYLIKDQGYWKKAKTKAKTNEEIISEVSEKIRKTSIFTVYALWLLWTMMGLAMSGPVSWALTNSMVFAIWLHPEKDRKTFADLPRRLRNVKSHPVRIVLSAFFLLLGTSMIFAEIEMKEKEGAMEAEIAKTRAAEYVKLEEHLRKVEEDKKSYAMPTITVKSPSGMQPTRKYVLSYSTSWATSSAVNGANLAWSGGEYRQDIELVSPNMEISITASNKYYTKTETVTVSRKKTSEELQIEKYEEAEKRWKERLARLAARKEEIWKMFSAWDGSYAPLVREIKSSMNDPSSFDHESTTWTLLEDTKKGDIVRVRMIYRWKNGFGGIVRQSVLAEINMKDNSWSILEE